MMKPLQDSYSESTGLMLGGNEQATHTELYQTKSIYDGVEIDGGQT